MGVGKKSSKSRRRDEPQAIATSATEAILAEPDVAVKASSEVAAAVPSLNQLSAEVLAAHDSFVRSPTAVVESLGIRVATAVARKLASTMPPPPGLTAKPLEA
jgi:hypothetical protein